MKRAAVLVVLALCSLVPAPHAGADGVRIVGITRLSPRHAPASSVPNEEATPRQVAPHAADVPANDANGPSAPAQTSVVRTSTPTLGVNAIGLTSRAVVPPDPAGEVGPTQFVHTVNTLFGARVGVYDKTNGALVTSFLMSDLAPSGRCRSGLGDGMPMYDQFDSVWFLTEIATRGNTLCIYVSDSPNAATATYTLYEVSFNVFPDYPKWAVWPDKLYLGFNAGVDDPMVAFNKTKMVAGMSLTQNDAVLADGARLRDFSLQILSPVDIDGAGAPTAPGIFVRHVDDEINRPKGSRDHANDFIEYYELTPDFTLGTATLAGPFDVPVAEFDSKICHRRSTNCIPQRRTRRHLDALPQPVMNRPVLRIVGSSQVMVGSFTVDAGHNRAGVRWFELSRPVATTTQGWTLLDEGTYAPGGQQRWVPSIDVNAAGDIALGYSASSRRKLPSIRFTGRLAGDTAGTMTAGETTIGTSKGPQTFTGRWGDYTEMSVDPVDNTTFWYTNEFIDRGGIWHTRFASFTLGP